MKTSLVLLALIGAAMAAPKMPTKIVGGEATTIEEYNFMASMQYHWGGIVWWQWCGGSLITSRSIVSAAHCYHGDQAQQWRVQVGSSYPETGGQVIYVEQLINHPQYNDFTLNYDVAVIRLSTAAVLSASVGTARIAGANYILADNTPVYPIGWGALWSGGPSPDVLQHVEVYTINWQLCADRYAQLKTVPGYANWPDITEAMNCAGILGEGGKDACQGDSGGPLVHNRDVVYGMTSWGFGCANGTYPGVSTHAPYFVDWIVANGST